MKKFKNTSKILATSLICGAILTATLPSFNQVGSTVFADTIGNVDVAEITAISVSVASDLNFSPILTQDQIYREIMGKGFTFRDQNGNIISPDLVDGELRIHNFGRHFDFNGWFKAETEGGLYMANSQVGGTFRLKSNPEVQSFYASNGSSGARIRIADTAPTIRTLESNTTQYAGLAYPEWSNVVFSDLEDDFWGYELQKSVTYPDEFNRDRLESGRYTIRYYVTDSGGNTSMTIETLTVVPTFAPEIYFEPTEIKASNVPFDPLNDVEYQVIDSIDGDISDTLKVVTNRVDTTREGEYWVDYSATNRFNKTRYEQLLVKVVADAPTLNVADVRLTETPSTTDILDLIGAVATDNVDGDITNSIRLVDTDIDLTTNGRYTATLTVTNSNGKTTEKTINFRVDYPVVTPEPEPTPEPEVPVIPTPEVPDTEEPEGEYETPTTPEEPEVPDLEDEVETPEEPTVPDKNEPEEDVETPEEPDTEGENEEEDETPLAPDTDKPTEDNGTNAPDEDNNVVETPDTDKDTDNTPDVEVEDEKTTEKELLDTGVTFRNSVNLALGLALTSIVAMIGFVLKKEKE